MAKTYKDDGIDWKANSDGINTRKNSSNIELTERATTNPNIFIDPVTVKFNVVDFINVINTRFSYFKFPVQTTGTSDLSDIDIDLGFEIDNNLFVKNQINRTYILSTVGSQPIPEINYKQYANTDGSSWPDSEDIKDLTKANKLSLQLETGSDPVDIFSVTDPLIKTLDEYDKLQASDGVINTFKFDVSVTYVPNQTLNTTQTSTAYFLRLLHTPFSNGDTTLGATTATTYTPSSYPWIVALDKRFDISSQAQDNYDRRREKVDEELQRDAAARKVELKKDPRNMVLAYYEAIIPLEAFALNNKPTRFNENNSAVGPTLSSKNKLNTDLLTVIPPYSSDLPFTIPGGDINQTIFKSNPQQGEDNYWRYNDKFNSAVGHLWAPFLLNYIRPSNTQSPWNITAFLSQVPHTTSNFTLLLDAFYEMDTTEYDLVIGPTTTKKYKYPLKLRDNITNSDSKNFYKSYNQYIKFWSLQAPGSNNQALQTITTTTDPITPDALNANILVSRLPLIREKFEDEWNAHYWSVIKGYKLQNNKPVTTKAELEQYWIERYQAYAPTEFVSRLNSFETSQSSDGSMTIQFEYAVPYGLLKHIREYIKNGGKAINFYLQAYSTFPAEVKTVNWKISIYSVPKASNSLTKDYKTNPHILNISGQSTYYGASTIPVDANDTMRVPDRFTGLLNVSDNCQLLLQYNPWDNSTSNYVVTPTGVPVATKHKNTFTALPVNIATVGNHIEMQVNGKTITSNLLNSWGFDRDYDLILGKV